MGTDDSIGVLIDSMEEHDWPAVRAIYLDGIRTGNATFENSIPEWNDWHARHLPFCRFVARSDVGIVGWAALSSVSTRPVYAGVAEVSVYIAEGARGRRLGSRLLRTLIEASEHNGLWTLQAGIFPENVASLELHKNCGFRIVGTRERVGCTNGIWRDVLLLERRSGVIGIFS